VTKAEKSMPWETSTTGKYQYHPGGDPNQVKDAPSAINVVVIPDVTLPKVRLPHPPKSASRHKIDSDSFSLSRGFTTSTTSGARTATKRLPDLTVYTADEVAC
jgi:hypothetical protein